MTLQEPKTKLAIIGASDFQNPLIVAAQERGIETHVFAWQVGDIGEHTADYFYPVSITEIDTITSMCRRLDVDGVACIGSDLGNITVSRVAEQLGLTANSVDCVQRSTDKELMRRTFEACGDPSPRSVTVDAQTDGATVDVNFPAIVKPADRSGSRGITKVSCREELGSAIDRALDQSFSGKALVEEFVDGKEYSVEYISWCGQHRFLAITEKFTTGAPAFIECGHLQPARLTCEQEQEIRRIVEHALNSLGVEYGASHAEVKVAPDGSVKIIEIGSRMGGDCIGSHLVNLSCGYDFVDAVIDVALGCEPKMPQRDASRRAAAIRFVFGPEDHAALSKLQACNPEYLDFVSEMQAEDHAIVDSGSRYGFFIFSSDTLEHIQEYLPEPNGVNG